MHSQPPSLDGGSQGSDLEDPMPRRTDPFPLGRIGATVLLFLCWAPASARASDGAETFAAGCATCHGAGGEGDGPVGAALDPKPADLTARSFQDSRTDDDIRRAIVDGGAAIGKSPVMPAFGAQLDAGQVDALVRWIRSVADPVEVPADATAPGAASPPPVDPTAAPAGAPRLPASSPFSRTRFHLAGFGTVHFQYTEETGPTFASVQLAPVFLWRLHDRFLFESELEFGYAGGEFDIALEYAQLDMLVWDYTTVVVGLSLQPLGIFSERLHPGWINRMMDAPYPYQGGHHSGPLPMAGLGIQARGAIPLGPVSSLNYVFFLTNGPSEADGAPSLGGATPDNNWDKFVGGRIGLLPVRELEIGISGTTGLWNDAFDQRFSALVGDLMIARDGLNFQGEVIATWTQQEEAESTLRSFWWAQLAYRLDRAPGPLNKFEFVVRYGGAVIPEPGHEGTAEAALTIEEPVPDRPRVAFSVGHGAGPEDNHGTGDYSGLAAGRSHQIGGGVNFYPIPSIAVRLGVHYTFVVEHFHLGLSVAAGF